MIDLSSTVRARVSIGSVELDNVSMNEAIGRIAQYVSLRRPRMVVTPNADHIVRAQHDEEFKNIVLQADLVLPDGMPILWAGRFLGTPFREKVSGSDLVPALCATIAASGHTVFFLGGREPAAVLARERTERSCPGLRVVGACSPPFGFEHNKEENADVCRRVMEAKPDILIVGLGAPKQEKWIYKHYKSLQVPVSISAGVTIELMAGMARRAPRWMQRTGLEWFWRLLHEPRRLGRRYLSGGS